MGGGNRGGCGGAVGDDGIFQADSADGIAGVSRVDDDLHGGVVRRAMAAGRNRSALAGAEYGGDSRAGVLVRLEGQATRGSLLVLFTLAIVWAGDTLAYFVGKFLGRAKMAPALSPKKTWEGAAGNMLGSLIVGYCFARGLHYDAMSWLATAALANIAGQVGDLVESAYKRGAGAKDSGALLPGHGGMLDRIDSLILAAPVVWLAAGWLLQGRQ